MNLQKKVGMNVRKYLLSEKGQFYKANLHCHTTISDGCVTPEDVKKAYKAKGYSIVAFTDHDVLVPHPELKDDSFLPLNGYEIEVTEHYSRDSKTCHMCLIGLDEDNVKQVCFYRSKYLTGSAKEYVNTIEYDKTLPDYERVYTPECINEIMKTARDNGFFVTYNHPTWSRERYNDYIKYQHMNAMEVFNNGAQVVGYFEYNEKEYDDMLLDGKRIYCVAADDNHSERDFFGGFTMIKAEKLEYKTITDALVSGNFYASQGPEIHNVWFEDGVVHIECSDVKAIRFNTGVRYAKRIIAKDGESICSAEFPITPDDKYVRITITDADGKYAYTNAYFTDELFD